MLILLPPSEGKAAPRRGAPLDLDGLSAPELTPAREQVLSALTALCAGEPERAVATLGLGTTQADEVRRNTGLRTASTARADRVYTGVLYEALDAGSLDAAARRRATRWLAVTSSLFGLLRPSDRIPSYRLPGSTTLPDVGGIAAHWRRALDPVVRDAAGSGLVVDLRSTTYAGFWRPAADLAPRVASVRVLHESGGRRTVVSHFNKATKGRLVRALLEHGEAPRRPAELVDLLGARGWKAELGPVARHGVTLDVVVDEV